MTHDRRQFIGRIAAGAMLGAFTPDVVRALEAHAGPAALPDDSWDMSWTKRITGKYRAVFDVPDVDSGYGVWRATMWANNYRDVLGATPKDLSAVIVLRHKGIALAMQQSFWDSYGVAKTATVLDPITQQGSTRNPALLSSSRNEVPAMFDEAALDRFLGRGGTVLACNVAFAEMVDLVKTKDKSDDATARKTAIAGLVPGVMLQPSGVFAALYAQEFGCRYLRAS